ncbi:MarR family winged helix-turn-helix transcriptional regulator [Lachnoanaerobaculum gingivalis]|uniref:MarR family winged helix-turn-helix transcriptional regulator n=1 Tax=Lachnoanaerobaculum gingivalis TaxID=2490855 RepID=UPI0024A65DCF|nr:MarR family transcriptional regulator [Lachnoanaerobaculum gingivalis]WHE86143.1 winged helix DNA-binding protein [Lachnoanaerobaculum gingivalis]
MSILRGSKEFKIILVKLFNDILDYEESVLRASEFKDLTNNDIHVIRAIGMNEKKNMSMIAKELAVTIGTLTISINSLVRKGYVIKERSEKDKRVVFVNLSSKGKAAFSRNEELYDQMVNSMLEDLEDNEMDILMRSLLKVNRCIKQNKA